MLLIRIIGLLLFANTFLVVTVESQDGGSSVKNDTNSTTCKYRGVNNITVHIGWPFYFMCKSLVDKFQAEVGYFNYVKQYMKQNATCTLRDENGKKQWEITAQLGKFSSLTKVQHPDIFDVTNTSTMDHIIEMNIPAANHCSNQDVHLQPERFVNNHTCESFDSFPPTIKRMNRGGALKMTCTLLHGEKPLLYFQDANKDDITYEWTHNCKTVLPINSRLVGDELTLREAEFGVDGGTYACSVIYKGRRRFIKRYQVCIKHVNAGKLTIKCPDIVEAKIGSEVNITCNVDFGPGPFNRYLQLSQWSKTTSSGQSHIFCIHNGVSTYGDQYFRATNSTVDDRAKCETVQISDINEKCFVHNPSEEEKETMKRLTRITLLIKKMVKDDVGSYILDYGFQTSTIHLRIDVDDMLIEKYTYIGVGVILIVLLLIVILLCVWRKTDLLWFLKKYFGAYEKDEKKYMAYLSYHFSSENMSDESQNLSKNLINGLYSFFGQFEGKVYDDHKDGNELQLQIENMARVQKQCHRIIIILNPEYVTDNWCLHKAYSGLRNMIEGGAKVIFIALPGVEKSFKQLENEPNTALKHAMKMNTTVHWSGKTPLNGKFRRHLEYALPKIRKNEKHKTIINAHEENMLIGNI